MRVSSRRVIAKLDRFNIVFGKLPKETTESQKCWIGCMVSIPEM